MSCMKIRYHRLQFDILIKNIEKYEYNHIRLSPSFDKPLAWLHLYFQNSHKRDTGQDETQVTTVRC